MADILFRNMNKLGDKDPCPMSCAGYCFATPALQKEWCVGVKRCIESGKMIVLYEHGDLVDRDELISTIRECNKSEVADVYPSMTWGEIGEMEVYDLSRFPVVIPANDERKKYV